MARRLLILLGLLFLFSISAKAQGIEVFGGYSYERFGISPGRNLNGVEIAAQYKFADWLVRKFRFQRAFRRSFTCLRALDMRPLTELRTRPLRRRSGAESTCASRR